MKRALYALILATIVSGVAAAYASAYPRPETPAKAGAQDRAELRR